MHPRSLLVLVLALPLAADAYAPGPRFDYHPGFELSGRLPEAGMLGTVAPGSAIAALPNGALVLDADSGSLVAIDRDGGPVARLALDAGAGLVVVDQTLHRAYVSDRAHDRIVVVDVAGGRLALAASFPTPGEPYGLALSADALLVTSIADRVVVAYAPATGAELWREPVAAEPRAVAIAPDGKHAIVTHLTTGDVELVDLGTHRRVHARPLRHDLASPCTAHRDTKSSMSCADPDATSYARGAFAATFLGNGVAVVAFQRESPVPQPRFAATQHYGGSAVPITRHVAYVGAARGQAIAQIDVDEPRALAWDRDRDLLYVAGTGNDLVLAIEHASNHPKFGEQVSLDPQRDAPCGVTGLALADGDLLAWCSFTRSVVRLRFADNPARASSSHAYLVTVTRGPAVTESRMSAAQHAGFVRFHHASNELAELSRVACASCHLDGRTDGLAWQIDGKTLRTPVLAGRLAGTAPYKWTGRDADLDASVVSTIDRLGGYGGTGRERHQLPSPDPLVAYLPALPPVRPPARAAEPVARGKALFDQLGCASCHHGPTFTDGSSHAFGGPELDTPSLLGTAASPRYLHDGSAPNLDAVLRDTGASRGMIPRPLSAGERADLAAFLESL